MKVWDLTMFAGSYEDNILDIRLNTLDSVVDTFCIVESDYTHSGIYKGFSFPDSLNTRFSKFKDKIQYYQIPYLKTNNPWDFEMWTREFLWQQICGQMKDDEVFISADSDEIPRPEYVTEWKDKLNQPITFILVGHQFCLDLRLNGRYNGGIMMRCKDKKNHLSYYRSQRTNFEREMFLHIGWDKVNDTGLAGWHFTSCNTPENIVKKLQGFAHVKDFADKVKNVEYIKDCIKYRKCDFQNPMTEILKPVEINYQNLPKYVVDNQNIFEKLFYKNYV